MNVRDKPVHKIVLNGRRMKVREIAEAINISEHVSHILNQDLSMRKLLGQVSS